MAEGAFRHVVMFRCRPGTESSAIAALHDALMALPAEIPEIVSYEGGVDLGLTDTTWDYALVADFASRRDFETYANHPAHLEVIERYVTPITADVVRVQYLR